MSRHKTSANYDMPTVVLRQNADIPQQCRRRNSDVGVRSRRCRPMPTLGQRHNASWVIMRRRGVSSERRRSSWDMPTLVHFLKSSTEFYGFPNLAHPRVLPSQFPQASWIALIVLSLLYRWSCCWVSSNWRTRFTSCGRTYKWRLSWQPSWTRILQLWVRTTGGLK